VTALRPSRIPEIVAIKAVSITIPKIVLGERWIPHTSKEVKYFSTQNLRAIAMCTPRMRISTDRISMMKK
jgi:hypothetical protein